MARGVFCYACDDFYEHPEYPEKRVDGHRVCPLATCSSEFIEELNSQPQTPLQSEAAPAGPNWRAAAAGGTQRLPDAPQTQRQQPQHGVLGRPHMQHHHFTTPGGHHLDVHVATTVLPVGMDLSGQGFEGLNTLGEGGADIPNPQAFISSLMQSLQNFQPDGQGGAPMMGGLFTAGPNGMQYHRNFNPGDFGGGQSLDALLEQLAEMHQPTFVPTAPATRDSLPRLKVVTPAAAAAAARAGPAFGTDSSNDVEKTTVAACKAGDACTVCHEEYEAGSEVVQLPCKHCFHDDCIMPWLNTHSTCPVCRHQLPTDPDHHAEPQPGPTNAATANALMGMDSGEMLPGPFLQRLASALQGRFPPFESDQQPHQQAQAPPAGEPRRHRSSHDGAAQRRRHASVRPASPAGAPGRRVRRRTQAAGNDANDDAALADLHHLFGMPLDSDQPDRPAEGRGGQAQGVSSQPAAMQPSRQSAPAPPSQARDLSEVAPAPSEDQTRAAAKPEPPAASETTSPHTYLGEQQAQGQPAAAASAASRQSQPAAAGVSQGFSVPLPGSLGALASRASRLFGSLWRR